MRKSRKNPLLSRSIERNSYTSRNREITAWRRGKKERKKENNKSISNSWSHETNDPIVVAGMDWSSSVSEMEPRLGPGQHLSCVTTAIFLRLDLKVHSKTTTTNLRRPPSSAELLLHSTSHARPFQWVLVLFHFCRRRGEKKKTKQKRIITTFYLTSWFGRRRRRRRRRRISRRDNGNVNPTKQKNVGNSHGVSDEPRNPSSKEINNNKYVYLL